MEDLPVWMNLSKAENLHVWQEDFAHLFEYDFVSEGKIFHDTLSYLLAAYPALAAEQPSLYKAYEALLLRSKWLTLALLQLPEVYDLFKHHILVALDLADFDIWERLLIILVATPTLETRDKIKKELRQALMDNSEVLTGQLVNDNKPITVGTFIKKAWERVGSKPMDSVEQNVFLVAETNLFEPQTKDSARKLLHLFERLKISSLELNGFEQPIIVNDGVHQGVIRAGVFEPYQLSKAEEEKFKIAFDLFRVVPPALNKAMQPASASLPIQSQRPAQPIVRAVVATPAVMKQAAPAFLFDLEDEKEADRFRSTNHESRITVLEKQLRAFADEVIKRKNLSFKDEANRRRFVQLFVSRLKDVRSVVDVREVLGKPVAAAGLGMQGDTLEQVIKIVEQAKLEFENRRAQGKLPAVVPEPELLLPPPPVSQAAPKAAVSQPPPPMLAGHATVNKPQVTIRPATLLTSDLPKPVSPIPKPPAIPQVIFDAQKSEEWRAKVLAELAQRASVQPTAAPVVRRPQIADVKAPPKVLGPLEELKSLTLVDFRRLAPTSNEALRKIALKIELIGETTVARKLEAVRAWQGSALYQLYLKTGRASIEQGKTVREVAAAHQALNESALTEDEFNAIVDFNAKLRF